MTQTNHANGHFAERVAARYLQANGYKVFALNWRTRRAEIDIVAQTPDGAALCFVEVKYRRTSTQGTGLVYITPRKLAQMEFAARLWTAAHGYTGAYVLSALEIGGADFQVMQFIESVT